MKFTFSIRQLPGIVVTLSLIALAGSAQAHVGVAGHSHPGESLLAGFVHPFTGWDHLLAMFAIGVLAVSGHRGRVNWSGPIGFVLCLMMGAALPSLGLALPGAEVAIALSVVALALLLGLRQAMPAGEGLALVAVAGLFHGYAHGTELGWSIGLAGMVLGSVVLHLLGIGVGTQLQRTPQWVRTALATAMGLGGGAMLLARL